MIEIKNETEKVILVGVSLSDQDDTKESLEELKDLVSTAGAETVGMVIPVEQLRSVNNGRNKKRQNQ